jgi:hypothetical protein
MFGNLDNHDTALLLFFTLAWIVFWFISYDISRMTDSCKEPFSLDHRWHEKKRWWLWMHIFQWKSVCNRSFLYYLRCVENWHLQQSDSPDTSLCLKNLFWVGIFNAYYICTVLCILMLTWKLFWDCFIVVISTSDSHD